MSEQNHDQSAEQERKFVDRLARLVYKSFEYSQGAIQFQRVILSYVKVLNPDWQVSLIQLKKIRQLLEKRITGRFYENPNQKEGRPAIRDGVNHTHSKDIEKRSNFDDAIRDVVVDLKITFFPDPVPVMVENKPDRDELIAQIFDWMLKRDLLYLVGKEGRPMRSLKENNPKLEPFMSHLRFYAGEVYSDSEPTFVEMFGDVREYLRNGLLTGQYKIDESINPPDLQKMILRNNYDRSGEDEKWPATEVLLSALAKRWEELHPGEDFFEPFDLPGNLGIQQKPLIDSAMDAFKSRFQR